MTNTILIIDDNVEVCGNISELLKLAGYQTFTAQNGKSGLQLAHEHKPNLILCDIVMPELDGYGVLRALDNIPDMEHVPFIFMTGKSDKSDFRRGMDLGADDYFMKPFNGDDLLKVVATRLKKKGAIQSVENHEQQWNKLLHSPKSSNSINSLQEHRTIKKLRKKDMLFMEGDSCNFLHFIISGKIKIFKSNDFGKEFIINIYKNGDFLGHISLLENSKHKESAMAIENTEVALIPREDFFQALYSNQEVAMKFIKLMSKDYAEAEDKLLKLAYDSARKRVAEAILYVSKKHNHSDSDNVSFSIDRENISSLSGISPESVSRNLSDLREEGLIETGNGTLKILNVKKLMTIKN